MTEGLVKAGLPRLISPTPLSSQGIVGRGGYRYSRTGLTQPVLEAPAHGQGEYRGGDRQDHRIPPGGGDQPAGRGCAICVEEPLISSEPDRGWCNRQHNWFWSSYSGFESSPPSSRRSNQKPATPAPSSRGLGHHPLKVATRVRIPLGLLRNRRPRHRAPAEHGLSHLH